MYLLDAATPSKQPTHRRRMLRACAAGATLFVLTLGMSYATLAAMAKQGERDRQAVLARCAAYPITCGKAPRP